MVADLRGEKLSSHGCDAQFEGVVTQPSNRSRAINSGSRADGAPYRVPEGSTLLDVVDILDLMRADNLRHQNHPRRSGAKRHGVRRDRLQTDAALAKPRTLKVRPCAIHCGGPNGPCCPALANLYRAHSILRCAHPCSPRAQRKGRPQSHTNQDGCAIF